MLVSLAESVGFYAVVPYVVMMIVGNAWGQLLDRLVVRQTITLQRGRKLSQGLATLLASLFLAPFMFTQFSLWFEAFLRHNIEAQDHDHWVELRAWLRDVLTLGILGKHD